MQRSNTNAALTNTQPYVVCCSSATRKHLEGKAVQDTGSLLVTMIPLLLWPESRNLLQNIVEVIRLLPRQEHLLQIYDRNKQKNFTECHHRYLLNYELINHFTAIFWQPIASAVVAYTAKKASGQSQCKKRKSLQTTTWEGSVHSLQTYSEQQQLRTTNYWWSNDTNNNYNDSDTIQNAKVDKTVS